VKSRIVHGRGGRRPDAVLQRPGVEPRLQSRDLVEQRLFAAVAKFRHGRGDARPDDPLGGADHPRAFVGQRQGLVAQIAGLAADGDQALVHQALHGAGDGRLADPQALGQAADRQGAVALQRSQQQLLRGLDRQVVRLQHRRGLGLEAVGKPLEPAAEKGGPEVGEGIRDHGGPHTYSALYICLCRRSRKRRRLHDLARTAFAEPCPRGNKVNPSRRQRRAGLVRDQGS
jgi:hypothetical protein